MKATRSHVVVLVTAPDLKVARQVARAALDARAAACANLVPGLESHYWWQGKRETSREVLVIIKTTRRSVRRLWDAVRSSHPYDTPEFLVLPLIRGSRKYLDWMDAQIL